MKNRLEELRKERGIKQEELAAELEVSRQTIGSLENGRYNPVSYTHLVDTLGPASAPSIFTNSTVARDALAILTMLLPINMVDNKLS